MLGGDDSVQLHNTHGKPLSATATPIGYWPDSSVKWMRLDAAIDGSDGETFTVAKSPAAEPPASGLTVTQNDTTITIASAEWTVVLGRSGERVIHSIDHKGRRLCEAGEFVCWREHRRSADGESVIRQQESIGRIDEAVIEQAGAVRAVVRLTGTHRRGEDILL